MRGLPFFLLNITSVMNALSRTGRRWLSRSALREIARLLQRRRRNGSIIIQNGRLSYRRPSRRLKYEYSSWFSRILPEGPRGGSEFRDFTRVSWPTFLWLLSEIRTIRREQAGSPHVQGRPHRLDLMAQLGCVLSWLGHGEYRAPGLPAK